MICMELMDMSLHDLRILVYERLRQAIPETVLGKIAESVSTYILVWSCLYFLSIWCRLWKRLYISKQNWMFCIEVSEFSVSCITPVLNHQHVYEWRVYWGVYTCKFSPLAKIFCVKDCIVNMATFAKLFSMNFFCNAKVAGLGEILSSENFHIYIRYSQGPIEARSSKRTCIEHILLLK